MAEREREGERAREKERYYARAHAHCSSARLSCSLSLYARAFCDVCNNTHEAMNEIADVAAVAYNGASPGARPISGIDFINFNYRFALIVPTFCAWLEVFVYGCGAAAYRCRECECLH